MKFIDEAIIKVKAGDGGNGCISFRREKFVPRGGPNGGDGGNGGDCIIKVKAGITTLMDFRYRKIFEAERGGNGMGKQMFGANGKDVVITIPMGTLVKDANTKRVIYDAIRAGAEFIVAKGGRGGHGNEHYATSTLQAPRIAQKGIEGKARTILLELKLLADAGLIGFPNAGKSMLISVISNAKPKVAGYPFTTKVPHLGVVRVSEEKSFVVADIPGLIEGAHAGAGMGVQFLKHIERTKVLLHLIDISDPAQPDPFKAYALIRKELKSYSPDLLKKPELIVLTKMDLTEVYEQKEAVEKKFKKMGKKVLSISAVKQEGLKALVHEVYKLLT